MPLLNATASSYFDLATSTVHKSCSKVYEDQQSVVAHWKFMQRQDTTARKWNASRPTYDEGWSDDEEVSQDEPIVARSDVQRDIEKLSVRPPWEVAVDGEVPPKASELGSTSLSAPAQHTSIEALSPTNTQHQHASRKENSQESDATLRSDQRNIDAHAVNLPKNENRPAMSSPVRADSPTEPNTSMRESAQLAKDPSAQDSFRRSKVDVIHSPSHKEESSSTTRNLGPQASMRQLDLSASTIDEAEDIRLESLMFSPEDLPYDQESYNDSDEDNLKESITEMYQGSDIGPDHDLDKRSAKHMSDVSSSSAVPSFPSDFTNGLTSRALSDGIMTVSDIVDKPEAMERSVSDSGTDAEVRSEVTTERTPSIMLSTNLWAEKNRLLKEQIEKNKKLQDKAAPVRASTYDVEYDYAQPKRNYPINQPTIVQERRARDKGVQMQKAEAPVEHIQDVSNLRTLHEEDEDDEVTIARKPISRSATPATAPPLIKAAGPSPLTILVASMPSSSAINAPQAVTSPEPPQTSRSWDTNKTLPEIRPNATPPTRSESASSSDMQAEQDFVVSAEEEHAMLKTLESKPLPLGPGTTSNKDLPPIAQLAVLPQRNSLPPIATNMNGQPTEGDAINAYTPSLYSAVPQVQEAEQAVSNEPEVADQIKSADNRKSLRRSQGQADLAGIEHIPTGNVSNHAEPIAGSWEPLHTKTKDAPRGNPDAELSRFSTSTIQTITDADNFTSDRHHDFEATTLVDKPYSDDGSSVRGLSPIRQQKPSLQVPLPITTSSSMATLQPPLRHMQSSMTLLSTTSTELSERQDGPLESERLADELLKQLSGTQEGSIDSRTVPISDPQGSDKAVVSLDDAESDQYNTNVTRMSGRGRTASTGSKFLEVITPGTSLEQTRSAEQIQSGERQMRSDQLLRYKDIKEMPNASDRIAEYRRRIEALEKAHSPLAEYLKEMQIKLQSEGRSLPGPVEHVEFKSSKSIIPDKLIPNDLSRTTARLGDKGIDAAKGLISKSSKGLKGLFHSNSRSVSGTKKSNISLPLESKTPQQAPAVYQAQQHNPSPIFQQTVAPPVSSHGTVNTQRYSPQQHEYAAAPSPQHMTSPSTQRMASPSTQHMASPSTQRASTPDRSRPASMQPAPNSPASARSRPQSSTVSHIQSYFPDCSTAQIEAALAHCGGNEQSAIGYLVVHTQSPVR